MIGFHGHNNPITQWDSHHFHSSHFLFFFFNRALDFNPWVGKIPWRREQLPTPVFWPGEFHGPYSPWGLKESDTTEWLSLFTFRLIEAE